MTHTNNTNNQAIKEKTRTINEIPAVALKKLQKTIEEKVSENILCSLCFDEEVHNQFFNYLFIFCYLAVSRKVCIIALNSLGTCNIMPCPVPCIITSHE
jgi:hypothetical protein